ncbi:MAG: TlpA disulfide reductase family protein [Bacteroidota bacterium]
MKILIFALLTAFTCLTASAQELTPKDIFLKTQEELLKYDRVAYTATSTMKLFDYEDIHKSNIRAEIIRNSKDTIFGGRIYFVANDTIERLYDLKHVYNFDSKKKIALSYDAHKGEEGALSGGIYGDVLWNGFIDPLSFSKRIDHSPVLVNDTVIDGRLCYQILTIRPDDAQYSDKKRWHYITKDSFIPVLFKFQVRFQDNYQYNTFQIHSWDFKKPKDLTLKSKMTSSYKIEKFVMPSRDERIKMLDVGTAAPTLSGKNYQNNLQVETINFKGRVTLLDFWYMSCVPCIKSIPEIEKIHEKYSAKGLQVIGINSSDNNEKGFKRLTKFLTHNIIKYPILFVSDEITKQYPINGWPTFYIIDKNAQVHFTGPYGSLGELDEIVGKLLE